MRLLDAALSLTPDLAIFPCEARGKRPLTAHGHLDASNIPARIRTWWTKTPNANIGCPTGDESFTVLDVDPRNDGDKTIARLMVLFGPTFMPVPTWTAKTPGGGWHYYFEHDPSITKCRTALAQGIDIKDAGGYVVVPPSATDAGPYRWLHGGPGSGLPLAPQPAWLLAARRKAEEPRRIIPTGEISTRSRGNGKPVPAGFMKGERDKGLFELACAWRGRGVPYDEAERAIKQSGALCDPPVSARHAVDRLRRAYQYPEGGAL